MTEHQKSNAEGPKIAPPSDTPSGGDKSLFKPLPLDKAEELEPFFLRFKNWFRSKFIPMTFHSIKNISIYLRRIIAAKYTQWQSSDAKKRLIILILNLKDKIIRSSIFMYGWFLWYMLKLRTDAHTRHATVAVMGGFTATILISVFVVMILPKASPDIDAQSLTLAEMVDPSVAPPPYAMIEAVPGKEPTVIGADSNDTDEDRADAQVQEAYTKTNASSFRFDNFVDYTKEGRVLILKNTALALVRQWFPKGSSARNFMRFFGHAITNGTTVSSKEALEIAKERCLYIPYGRVFSESSVVCTYSSLVPSPLPNYSEASVFWIISISYDQNLNITGLELHARNASNAN